MEATTKEAVHRPIGFGGAFTRQLGLLWTSRRPLLLLVAVLAALVLAGDPWTQDPKTRLLLLMPLWLTLVGPIWAFAVFHNEGPGSRLYHWSQPVSRSGHTLARLLAGVAWLWIILAALALVGALLAWADGDGWQLGLIGFSGWVNYFTGPLLGYLGVSILTVASDYPIRWFFGLMFLIPLGGSMLHDWLGLRSLTSTLAQPLTDQDWGIAAAMVGAMGRDLFALDQALTAMADPGHQTRTVDFAAYWWAATPGWILLIGAVVVFMATRHPDVLPRLRRSG